MPDGSFIETERVEAVAEAVQGAAGTMGEAASYAEEADPDPYMWGVVGAPLGLAYTEVSSRIQSVLDRLPDAFAGLAGRIDESARAVADCDAEVGERFGRLFDEFPERGLAQ